MTIYEIHNVIGMIDECAGTSNPVDTVWEYTNRNNNEVMFAVFTKQCYNDIWESPAVKNPKCIYSMGQWQGDYAYLNED
jgi:hypothetical protein